jgi:hypothetical protein
LTDLIFLLCYQLLAAMAAPMKCAACKDRQTGKIKVMPLENDVRNRTKFRELPTDQAEQ